MTLAKPTIKRASPNYYSALVANAALGNGFVSRINREIRIKRGLSYGAGSSLDPAPRERTVQRLPRKRKTSPPPKSRG